MPIDSISATNNKAHWQQVRNDFQTIAQSLQSGNVQVAQKAYALIQQDQQNGPQPPADSPAAQAFAQLGQALQSGDIAGAQQALSAFQSTIKNARQARGGRGPHGGGVPAVDGDDASGDSDSADATKTVSNEATVQNPDGTTTVTTTYSDGSTSTETKAKPAPPVVSQRPLAANAQQLAALLNAQEQAAE